jgi:hypothetical protein
MSTIRGNAHGLVDWSGRDPWRKRMGVMIEKHLSQACELNDVAIEELTEVIGPSAMTALDCVFEDFCTTVWEDESNIATDYLKRRGWKETAINRAYIEALRGSVMSLYEISDVRPGESFLARDLVRGGEPVRVIERTATKTLVAWDVIATRIVTVRGKVQLTSAVLAVDRGLAEEMLGILNRTKDRLRRETADVLKGAAPALRDQFDAELADQDQLLRTAASTITTLWLNDAIRSALAPPPALANTDGDPLEFMTLHYRIAPAASAADIVTALSGVPDLRAEDDGAHWTLFAPKAPSPRSRTRKGAPDPDTGRTIHASLSLERGVLKVLVNSEARAARVRDLLYPALADVVREPLVERVTPEQAMVQAGATGASISPSLMPEGVDPTDLRAAIHEVLDRQYRKTLGEPVPMLNGKTPRQAVRSAKGRQAVANWLKSLEQTSARCSVDDPMRDYDFSWMWKELGVADLRS